jgi:hypothetical protein
MIKRKDKVKTEMDIKKPFMSRFLNIPLSKNKDKDKGIAKSIWLK